SRNFAGAATLPASGFRSTWSRSPPVNCAAPKSVNCVVHRLILSLALLLAVAVAVPCRAQQLPPTALSQIEPLPVWSDASPGPPDPYFDLDAWTSETYGPSALGGEWRWQLLPDGILYQAYLANPKESRISTVLLTEKDDKTLWDSVLGGRVGLVRFGTTDPAWPQGWQFDFEGSAQVRLDPDLHLDLRSTDFRAGAP